MTHEQQLLLQKSQQNIRAAKLLSEEGLYDIAVSRAYYAMFYLAEAFLIGENLNFSKHAGVISKFGEIFAWTGQVPTEFHRHLIQAQQSRTRADYDPTPCTSAEETVEQIRRAEVFLAFSQTRLQEDDR